MNNFQKYLDLTDELTELQKLVIVANKEYNNELKLFQKATIIDFPNAERIKAKYDEWQTVIKKIAFRKNELRHAENEIISYLIATNGMAIRYTYSQLNIERCLIFDISGEDPDHPSLFLSPES